MNALSKPLMVVAGAVVCLIVGAVAGYNWCNSGKQKAVLKRLDKDAEAVAEIREVVKWRTRKVTEYVDKIKEVYVESGCADEPAHRDIDDGLWQAYRLAAGPKADGAMRVRPISKPSEPENPGDSTGEPVETGSGL